MTVVEENRASATAGGFNGKWCEVEAAKPLEELVVQWRGGRWSSRRRRRAGQAREEEPLDTLHEGEGELKVGGAYAGGKGRAESEEGQKNMRCDVGSAEMRSCHGMRFGGRSVIAGLAWR